MDILLALGLAHSVLAIAWAASGLVLGFILLAARGDAGAEARALPEARLLGRRVLRPLGLGTLLTGGPLAAQAGLLLEAWVVLGAGLVLGVALLRHALIEPALRDAQAGRGRPARALGLAALDPAATLGTGLLMALRPGWGEAAILAGLLACLLLAAALLRSLQEATAQPA